MRNAPNASVATALVARQATVQPTRPVVRSASPALVASRDASAMDSRDYKGLPATMPGDVPVGGPGRAGPPAVYCPSGDRPTPEARRRPGRPCPLHNASGGYRRAVGVRALPPAGEPGVAAIAHGAGRRYLCAL